VGDGAVTKHGMPIHLNKRLLIAYHEAGHAVIARMLGVGVPYIALFSTDDSNSAAAPSQSAFWAARDSDVSARIAGSEIDGKIALAGPCAQHRYEPVKNIRRLTATDWAGDFENARSYACRVVLLKEGIDSGGDSIGVSLNERQLDELNRSVDQWWEGATALVEKHWPAIERVAEALLDRPLLDERALDALIANRAGLDKLLVL
jgi:hypothetical protein